MDKPITERRHDTRFSQPLIAATQAILRPGYAVSLIDLSAGGALIQGPRPLRPGARVHLQLLTPNRRLAIPAHVLRCAVSSLDSRQGVQYRGAIKFDHRCDTLWEDVTPDGYLLPLDASQPGPDEGHPLPKEPENTSSRVERDRD